MFQLLEHLNLPRLMLVGRLDVDTSGLLLLTSCGRLSRHLELPASGYVREYSALIATGDREITQEVIDVIGSGLTLPDGTRFRPVSVALNHTMSASRSAGVRMQLADGQKREIRRIWAHFGFAVSRLKRERYGPFQLGNLPLSAVEEILPSALQPILDKF